MPIRLLPIVGICIALSACGSAPTPRYESPSPLPLDHVERFEVTPNKGFTTIRQVDSEEIDPDKVYPPTVTLGPELEKDFGKHTVKVKVTARSPAENGAPILDVRYATLGGDGKSPPADFRLTSEFVDYEFDFLVPFSAHNPGSDGIYLLPKPPGAAVDIKSVVVSMLRPADGH
jgi:hypothetical protein